MLPSLSTLTLPPGAPAAKRARPGGVEEQDVDDDDDDQNNRDNQDDEKEFERVVQMRKEANEIAYNIIKRSTKPDKYGKYGILDNPRLWELYSFGRDSQGNPIVVDKLQQKEIVDGFAYALYSSDRELFDDWFSKIPTEADIFFGDLFDVRTKNNSFPVLEPQSYRAVRIMDQTNMALKDQSLPYGYFYPTSPKSAAARNDAYEKLPYDETHFCNRATTRAGDYFKLHPALLQHVRAWPLWEKRSLQHCDD
tara:strand:- start:650 stop:1402 length:753 start_codon:yes stop_codon:yes gene_type:complete